VQTQKDIIALCRDEEQFVGKPLTALFSEIKPEIKLVLAEEGSAERPPTFVFFFTSKSVYARYRKQDKLPLRLSVYVKESLGRPKKE
jgi:hypothetical protein